MMKRDYKEIMNLISLWFEEQDKFRSCRLDLLRSTGVAFIFRPGLNSTRMVTLFVWAPEEKRISCDRQQWRITWRITLAVEDEDLEILMRVKFAEFYNSAIYLDDPGFFFKLKLVLDNVFQDHSDI